MSNAPDRTLANSFYSAPFVVCDEVRSERSGKDILIGAYPGNQIVLTNFPGFVSCNVWTAFFALKLGRLAGQYQVRNGSLVVASGQVLFEVAQVDVMPCTLKLNQFRIEGPPAFIEVQLRFDPEDWFTVGFFVVRKPIPEPNLPLFGGSGTPPAR